MSWLCAENRMNTALIVFRALHGFPAAEGAAFYGKTFEKAPPAVGGFYHISNSRNALFLCCALARLRLSPLKTRGAHISNTLS